MPTTDEVIAILRNEIWQADHNGEYRRTGPDDSARSVFTGFGRRGSDENGMFSFLTVKPGPVSDGQAPHINVIVFARGMLSHAYTRLYFSDETDRNMHDPVLQSIESPRRQTLVAERNDTRDVPRYLFDIHLQGVDDTVFFDF